MDYAAALQWWFDRVDFEKRPAGRDEIKLDRMRMLMQRLGQPQVKLRVVHVAGSKGKGSTAAMIAACAQAAGITTGLFTSPHLSDVRERIQVNGQPITTGELAECLTELFEPVSKMEAGGHPPTFFEIATAAAFYHFQKVGVEVAVMEVGLGGRFDATNVCMPAISVITSISYDHTAILGDKLSQIAFEKSGIIKDGVPVVSGVTNPEAREVIRRVATDRNARLYEVATNYHFSHSPGQVSLDGTVAHPKVTYQLGDEARQSFDISLLGQHQAANASAAITTLRILNSTGVAIGNPAIRAGLESVVWPARLEIFPGQPLIVLDCAHNVASAQMVAKTLAESFQPCRKALVFACSSDKDVPGILEVLAPSFAEIIMTRFGINSRAVPPARLAEIMRHRSVHQVESSLAALNHARRLDAAMVVITGSVFLAGELRPRLLERNQANLGN